MVTRLFLITIVLVLVSTKVSAEDFAIKNIATVDLKKIVDGSKAAKAAEEEVKKLQKIYINETKVQEASLKKGEEQLRYQQKALSQEAFAKKVQEFRQRIAKEQNEIMKKKKILETAYIKSLELIRNETVKVVEGIAKEKNLDMVIAKGNVLFSKESYDISDEVLEQLNKKLAKVNISVDKK